MREWYRSFHLTASGCCENENQLFGYCWAPSQKDEKQANGDGVLPLYRPVIQTGILLFGGRGDEYRRACCSFTR